MVFCGGKRGREEGGGRGWSGGGGYGCKTLGGEGGEGGADGEPRGPMDYYNYFGPWEFAGRLPGGRGSRAVLPRITGFTLTPGRGGQPLGCCGGGGGGVLVNGLGPKRTNIEDGEGYGAGAGGEGKASNGFVIIYTG